MRVVLSGHEHFYQRTTPQRGITLVHLGRRRIAARRRHPPHALIAAQGFDIDYHFMLFEVTRDQLFYQAISRTGHSVDAGKIERK